jgi:restriction system protein
MNGKFREKERSLIEQEKENLSQLAELDILLKEIDELIIQFNKFPEALATSLPHNLIDAILRGAVNTMIITLEKGYYYHGAMNKKEYEILRPLLDHWKKACKEKKFDEELFNDFKSSLTEFTEKNPDWATDDWTIDRFFKEKVWVILDGRYKKARKQANKLNNILGEKKGRANALVQSEYALIDPYQFEHLISELFQKMGYKTEVTSATCDYGIDVIANKDQDTIAIQAKKYSKGNNVGNRDVQMLLGAMQFNSVKANKAILITSSDFTVQAKEQAKEAPIELWNGKYLSQLITKYL